MASPATHRIDATVPAGSWIGFPGGRILFFVMPQGGNLMPDSQRGHYIDLRADEAQILAVDDFRGAGEYADAVPGFKVHSIEPITSDDPADEGRIHAVYLVRDGREPSVYLQSQADRAGIAA